jgi:adenosyl cobinamide kinase/adenosyl cobinamide phosphate guanylyltransferase
MPVPPRLFDNNIYFDIPLQLEANPTLYGVIDVMPEVDFVLSEPRSLFYPTVMSSDLLRACFYYNSENGITKAYITENSEILAALAASVNQVIFCDLFNLIYSRFSDNENNPAMYPNAIVGGVPEQGGFGSQVIQYLSSAMFTNPAASGPIANIREVIDYLMQGAAVSVVVPAVIDVNNPDPDTNVITPATTTKVRRTLGQQFVTFIQSKTEPDGTNDFVHNLFEQILAVFPERFDLTDNSLEGVYISLPFNDTDRINFDIVLNGSLSLHLTATTTNPCSQVNYAQPSLLRMFPKSSTDPSWTHIINYDTSSRSSLTLIPKTFRANLCLSGDQDISKIHSLYATKILLANANRNLSLTYTLSEVSQTVATKDIYSTTVPTTEQIRDRKFTMSSIFATIMATATKLTAVSGNNAFAIGTKSTMDLLEIFVNLLQDLHKITLLFRDLAQYDFDQADTSYYSNDVGPSAVNTCSRITSANFAAGNSVLNMSLINESIRIAMKSLSHLIGSAFHNDTTKLSIDKRIRHSLIESLPAIFSITNVIKVLCNPLETYLKIDYLILRNTYSVLDDIFLATSQQFQGYGPSLLNVMSLIDISIMSLYMVTNRPIEPTSASAIQYIKHPNMFQIADLSKTVVDTLDRVDVVNKTSTFIPDLCDSLSSMINLMVATISPTQFDLPTYIRSFNDPLDRTYLTTIFNHGGVINTSNKLVFTKLVQSGGVVTYLDEFSYDLINNLPMTTDLTSTGQPGIFADYAQAQSAKSLIMADPSIPQINDVNASTGLNNYLGYSKSKSIMGGVNNGTYVKASIAHIAAQADALAAQNALDAAQIALTSAQAADAAAQDAAQIALALSNSRALTTFELLREAQRLIEIRASDAEQAKGQTAYLTAKAASDEAATSLIAANTAERNTTKDLLKAQHDYNAILSNYQAQQAILYTAYEHELLCKRNKLYAQNTLVKSTSESVITAWRALKEALGASTPDSVLIDSATATINASLMAAKAAVSAAIVADNEQLIKDATNAIELPKNISQLEHDERVSEALNQIADDIAKTPIVIDQGSINILSDAISDTSSMGVGGKK